MNDFKNENYESDKRKCYNNHTHLEKLIYSADEVSELIGLGMNKVYELLANGEIPSKRVGRKYLIPKVSLEKWVLGQLVVNETFEPMGGLL